MNDFALSVPVQVAACNLVIFHLSQEPMNLIKHSLLFNSKRLSVLFIVVGLSCLIQHRSKLP